MELRCGDPILGNIYSPQTTSSVFRHFWKVYVFLFSARALHSHWYILAKKVKKKEGRSDKNSCPKKVPKGSKPKYDNKDSISKRTCHTYVT